MNDYNISVRNLHSCADYSGVALCDLFTHPSIVRKKLKDLYRESTEVETLVSFNALTDLCFARDNLMDIFDDDEIER